MAFGQKQILGKHPLFCFGEAFICKYLIFEPHKGSCFVNNLVFAILNHDLGI